MAVLVYVIWKATEKYDWCARCYLGRRTTDLQCNNSFITRAVTKVYKPASTNRFRPRITARRSKHERNWKATANVATIIVAVLISTVLVKTYLLPNAGHGTPAVASAPGVAPGKSVDGHLIGVDWTKTTAPSYLPSRQLVISVGIAFPFTESWERRTRM
jgi:hypothetical protein